MLIEYNTIVKCTREEAWKLIVDIERRPDWVPFMERCYFTDFKEGWVGSKYQEKEVFLGIPLNINYEVIAYKENDHLRSRCFMPPFYPKVDINCSDAVGGCNCGLIIDIKLGPFALIPQKLIRKQIDDLVQPLIDNFKQILERESVLNK